MDKHWNPKRTALNVPQNSVVYLQKRDLFSER